MSTTQIVLAFVVAAAFIPGIRHEVKEREAGPLYGVLLFLFALAFALVAFHVAAVEVGS